MTNYEYLNSLEWFEKTLAILDIGDNSCVLCPRDREDRCNEDCTNGIIEWFEKECDPTAPVWTEEAWSEEADRTGKCFRYNRFLPRPIDCPPRSGSKALVKTDTGEYVPPHTGWVD